MDIYGKPKRQQPYAALFVGSILLVILLVGLSFLLSIDLPCVVCEEAKAHCPNGYRINEDCTKGIYGYKCTNDGLNITYSCTVPI